MVIPLNYLEESQTAQIIWMALPGDKTRQLYDLGLKPDVVVTCVKKSSGKGMAAFQIQNRIIALRPKDANGILVKYLTP